MFREKAGRTYFKHIPNLLLPVSTTFSSEPNPSPPSSAAFSFSASLALAPARR